MRRVVVFRHLGKTPSSVDQNYNPKCSSVGRVVVVQGYDHDSLIQKNF